MALFQDNLGKPVAERQNQCGFKWRKRWRGLGNGSGISWTICKQSAPHSRQITTPTPHHSIFYRPDALPDAQPTVSKSLVKDREVCINDDNIILTRIVPSSLPLHSSCGPRRAMSHVFTNVWWPRYLRIRSPTCTSHIDRFLSVAHVTMWLQCTINNCNNNNTG